MLSATVNASGVTLELTNLHGDIVAIASTSGSATGPTATYVYTEFGTPENGSPGMYGWLGGYGISSAALGSDVLMGVRSYNTSTGRFDQVDPIPGGNANAYDYVFQNPLTNYDLSGMCGSWGHGTWGVFTVDLDFNSCVAYAIAAFFGPEDLALGIYLAIVPISWAPALALAIAVLALAATLAAWAAGCDITLHKGPRITMSYTNHNASNRYAYTGFFYPTFGCWG
jgi:RHS repeat-associated protein